MASYPLDNLDFIMMDLERPASSRRFADFCTGDLTGRLLEFLSSAEGIDGCHDARLKELFERILLQRKVNGLFGRTDEDLGGKGSPYGDFENGAANKIFSGLTEYFERLGDIRALTAARGIGDYYIQNRERFIQWIASKKGKHDLVFWITVPLAKLFHLTGERKYLELCALLRDGFDGIEGVHSHGFMTTLRGLQLATIYTGERSWSDKAERLRERIIAECLKADGGVSEFFPDSFRNEGCSIADWMMMNLNHGLITGDESAYEMAEHTFYNAFAFNQLTSGTFGLRDLKPHGYAVGPYEEAWWCCVNNCGLALAEYARHAVCLRARTIHVNFLLPGRFNLGGGLTVTISTCYPSSAYSIIRIDGDRNDLDVKVRVPRCLKNVTLTERADATGMLITMNGSIGHTLEKLPSGVILKYGPLVLAPQSYYWYTDPRGPGQRIPAGTPFDVLPAGIPRLLVSDLEDPDGFLRLAREPYRLWNHRDAGPNARFHVKNAEAKVTALFDSGEKVDLVFTPLCSATSTMAMYETPFLFRAT